MSQHFSKMDTATTHPRVESLIVGQSSEIRNLKKMISTVARSQAPVMLQGDTGVGKELAALAVHFASGRSGEFVAVNCAAIPQELLESELFGHDKGAFTGAIQKRIGKFEQASGGTIFLDEIGDMPLDLQAKLLRVLESKKITPVGSNREIEVDFRLVTATHRNMDRHVAKQKFREDLYYRINVFPLYIPSLAARREDIPLILERMIATHLEANPNALAPHFSQCAVQTLQAYDWPGNVRELRNVLERAFAFFEGSLITSDHVKDNLLRLRLPSLTSIQPSDDLDAVDAAEVTTATKPTSVSEALGLRDLRTHLRDIEADLIQQAMREVESNVTQAADLLGLQRTTLVEKIKKLGIER